MGFVLIFLSLVGLILFFVFNSMNKKTQDRLNKYHSSSISIKRTSYEPDDVGNIEKLIGSAKMLYLAGALFMLGLLLISTFYSKVGYQYHIVSPFGSESVINDPGYKLIIPGSIVTEWEKLIDMKTVP